MDAITCTFVKSIYFIKFISIQLDFQKHMLDKYDWIFNHNMIKLWRHKYSSGKTKFVDCQHFDGLWGRIFVINWFVALKCNTIH